MTVDKYGPNIQMPISRQPISAAEYGIPMRAAVQDLDNRANALETVGIGFVAPPILFGGNGTICPSTGADTRDALMGNYAFQALDGVRYKVWLVGRAVTASVAGDRFSLHFRYTMTGSSPVTGDTQIGHDDAFYVPVTGSAGSGSRNLICSFIPGAGLCTVGVFLSRVSGSGTGTPTGSSEFYAELAGDL
jgi:hypothetical protein